MNLTKLLITYFSIFILTYSSVNAAEPTHPAGPLGVHSGDYRTCKVCQAALQKSMGYLKANLQGKVLNSFWYAEFIGAFYAGFSFLMEGNSPNEAKQCAEQICRYLPYWPEHHMGYEGWFCSMAMLYLSEYSLRYGLTPKIAEKLEWGAKWVHKTREKEGGWFHGPRWGQGNYALDISTVGCGYYLALENMRILGLNTGPALDEARDYVSKVCDGRSVAYGLYGKGGFSLAATSYVLIGLTNSGQTNDPRVAGISAFFKSNYQDARKAHACGYMQHFGVALAMSRIGPEAYAPFAQYYLHDRLIPNMREDGSLANFPNDSSADSTAAYAGMKDGSDYVATAVFTSMILLERPGAFIPLPTKKAGGLSNKDAFKLGMEAMEKGDSTKAYIYFAQVLPLGDSEELVPNAQDELKKLEEPLRKRISDAKERESREMEDANKMIASRDFRGAIKLYDGVIKNYESILKDLKGIPFSEEVRGPMTELKKIAEPLRLKAVYAPNQSPVSPTESSSTNPASLVNGSTESITLGALNDSALLKIWESKVKDRLRGVILAGIKPQFYHKSLSTRVTVSNLSDSSFQANLDRGGQMDMAWTQLKQSDWVNLVESLAEKENTPLDHALAAFFLLLSGEQVRGREELSKAGNEGTAVTAAFKGK